MLIDWPDDKARLDALFAEAVRRETHANAPLVSAISTFSIWEGDRAVFVDAVGNRSALTLRAHEAEVVFSREEMLGGGGRVVDEAIAQLGASLGKQLDKGIIREMERIPPHIGGKFRGSTPEELTEQLVRLIEGMEIDFDFEGRPTVSFVAHPNSVDQLKRMEEDPELTGQFDRIMEVKRHEWATRESRRRLVD